MAKGNLVNWVLGARNWRLGNKEWGMELGDWGMETGASGLFQPARLLPYDYIPPGTGLFDVTFQLET